MASWMGAWRFGNVGMVRVFAIGQDLEPAIEARNASTILRRSRPLSRDVARVLDIRVALADLGERKPVLPAVAEVINIVEDGLSGINDVAQTHRLGLQNRRRASVFF